MRVQIVYPDDNWILNKLAKYLIDNIDYVQGSILTPDITTNWDLTYFINYFLYSPDFGAGLFKKPLQNSKKTGAFFTHKDIYTYEKKAKKLDFCICPCTLTADYLKKYNKNTHVIYHGIDLDRFKPKLTLGFIGKKQQGNRKGMDLFDLIQEIPFVELKATNGTLSEDEIPEFYHSIDYVLIASTVEGGPLCFQEGLASGKEIISTDVGMVHDFKQCEGIYIFDRENPETLINILHELYDKKLKKRQLIEQYSIEYFVNEHKKLFQKFCS